MTAAASSPEDSGTAAPDPRGSAMRRYMQFPSLRDFLPDALAAIDAADRAAGVIRVRVDDARRQAIELAMMEALADVHARYPDGIKSSHIAVFLTAAALRVLTEP